MSKRKLLLSGATIAELRKECEGFLAETNPYQYPGPDPIPPLPGPDAAQLPLVPQPQAFALDPAVPGADRTVVHATGDTDKRGIRWDARVHSSNKEVTVKGAWRKKRGVEDAELHRVEQESLRGGSAPIAAPGPALVPAPQPVAPQYPPQHLAPPVAQPGNAYPQPPQSVSLAPVANVIPLAPPAPIAMNVAVPVFPAAPSQPTTPTPQVVSLAHNLATFKANLPMVLAKLVQDGKINQDYIASVKQGCGIQEIWQMNDAQIEEFFNMLVQYQLITRMP